MLVRDSIAMKAQADHSLAADFCRPAKIAAKRCPRLCQCCQGAQRLGIILGDLQEHLMRKQERQANWHLVLIGLGVMYQYICEIWRRRSATLEEFPHQVPGNVAGAVAIIPRSSEVGYSHSLSLRSQQR